MSDAVTTGAAVVQALTLPFVGASVVYAGRQLAELRRQVVEETKVRRLESTRSYLEHVGADEVRQVRRWLLTVRSAEFQPHQLSDDDRARVLRLAVAYDRVGLMVAFDLLDAAMVFAWQGRELARLWNMVSPVIAVERSTPGRDDYCRYFEELAVAYVRATADGPAV